MLVLLMRCSCRLLPARLFFVAISRINSACHLSPSLLPSHRLSSPLSLSFPVFMSSSASGTGRTGRRKRVKVEYEEEVEEQQEAVTEKPSSKRKGVRAAVKKEDGHDEADAALKTESVSVKEEQRDGAAAASSAGPAHWREVWEGIVSMRSARDAPVDGDGCERLSEVEEGPEFRYQTLTALMLSAQTKDATTAAAMRRLHAELPGGLTIASILAASVNAIDSLICKVGFHTRKASFIKRTAAILHEHYGDDIPDSIAGLCSLPGVGPKMAYLTMQVAWHRAVGIGVDTHVHRISNRLGWCRTREAEQTREALEAFFPSSLWNQVNLMLVGFGQQVCLPVNPRCDRCRVNEFCPVGRVNVKRIARGLTPVKQSKDEARAAVKLQPGVRRSAVKYAKFDESQLTAQQQRNEEIATERLTKEEEREAQEAEDDADRLQGRAEAAAVTGIGQRRQQQKMAEAEAADAVATQPAGRSRRTAAVAAAKRLQL